MIKFKKTYDLSEAEQRDLFNLIQQGKALPEKYRFILFEDKREVELVWNGKTRDVCTTVLPFQTLEHIDEPRKETKTQGDLFDSRGRQMKGWSNKLIWGDNKLILSSLKAGPLRQQIEDAGGLKLIYIDPPFDVGADFSLDIEIGGETFHKEPNLLEQIAYRDTWGRGADSFISMLYERLILMRDLLAADGSIYVHMGWGVSHYVRGILDEVFGRERALNQIIWKRQTAHSDSGQGSEHLGRLHDVILLYSKDSSYTWNMQYGPYSDDYLRTHYKKVEPETGRRYELDNIIGPGGTSKGNPVYEFLGVTRSWRYSRETMARLYSEGRIIQPSPGSVPRYLQRKEIIKVPVGTGIGGVASLEGFEHPQRELNLPEFEERWTGGYIFENEWQSFRTRQSRDLDLTTATHTYDRPGRYTVAVKVIDIFGNDTMTLVPVNVG